MSITQAKVAIITVTFNSSGFITNYLNALSCYLTDSSFRLIIVDNASTDDTVDRIKQFTQTVKLPETCVQIIKLKKNIGFGRGCNEGVRSAAKSDALYYWFLNPDTEALADSAIKLLDTFQQHKEADFVGSVLTDEQQQIRAGAFRFPTITNICLSTLRLRILDSLFTQHTTAIPIEKKPYRADWLTGASFMAKKSAITKLEAFDPHYFLYFEEVDLFYRAKKSGLSAWCAPDSKVFHISGASTGINQKKQSHLRPKRQPKYWFESRRYFYLKNYGRLYFILLDFLQVTCLLVWKLRTKLQKKHDDTAKCLLRDIIKHSYLATIITKKK
ncbi:glycosyltransferase family 2 protein [Eionea flava]